MSDRAYSAEFHRPSGEKRGTLSRESAQNAVFTKYAPDVFTAKTIKNQFLPTNKFVSYEVLNGQTREQADISKSETSKLFDLSIDRNPYPLLLGAARTAENATQFYNALGAITALHQLGKEDPFVQSDLTDMRNNFVTTTGESLPLPAELVAKYEVLTRSHDKAKVIEQLRDDYFKNNPEALFSYFTVVMNSDVPSQVREDFLFYLPLLIPAFNVHDAFRGTTFYDKWTDTVEEKRSQGTGGAESRDSRSASDHEAFVKLLEEKAATEQERDTARAEVARLRRENEKLRPQATADLENGLPGGTEKFEQLSDLEVFGFSPGFTKDQVNKKMVNLANTFHPDRVMSGVEVVEEDPEKRAYYRDIANRKMKRVLEAKERLLTQVR